MGLPLGGQILFPIGYHTPKKVGKHCTKQMKNFLGTLTILPTFVICLTIAVLNISVVLVIISLGVMLFFLLKHISPFLL